MGICTSGPQLSPEQAERLRSEKMRSQAVENEMKRSMAQDRAIHKLLLLGAGESGKSTLFKQMIELYGKKFSDEDRRSYRKVIYENMICSMQLLLEASEQFDGCSISEANQQFRQIIMEGNAENLQMQPTYVQAIQALWADPGIQAVYRQKSKLQLPDSAEYFFTNAPKYIPLNYIPSTQDVLRTRVRTTGIVETQFVIENVQFKMFDVGGQRNERKKWIHCFDNVVAVIFVTAISEYDQVCFEDVNTNRLDESLRVFEEICNSAWFSKTAMILFLNKVDLFEKKFPLVPLSSWDPAFKQDWDAAAAKQWILQRFLAKNHRPNDREIYPHVTCATDSGNVKAVFVAVKDIVLRQTLRLNNLM